MAADSLPAPEPASVLVYGGTVLSFDSPGAPQVGSELRDSVRRRCEILVQRGVVASLGKSLTLMPGTQLLDVTGHLVVPGLIAGTAALDLQGELASLDEQAAYEIALPAAIRALLGGVTTVLVDSQHNPTPGEIGFRRALVHSGLRVVTHDDDRDGAHAVASYRDLRGATDPAAAIAGATVGAARSLGRDGDLGGLGLGQWADMAIFAVEGSQLDETPDDRVAELALSGHVQLRHVLVAGSAVVRDARPRRHDLEALEAAARKRARPG